MNKIHAVKNRGSMVTSSQNVCLEDHSMTETHLGYSCSNSHVLMSVHVSLKQIISILTQPLKILNIFSGETE